MQISWILTLPGLLGMALRRHYWRIRLGSLGAKSNIYGLVRIYVPRRVVIGDNVSINNFVHIWGGGGVSIGDHTLIAAHTIITSQTHDVDALASGRLYRQTNRMQSVSIGRNVWIGTNVVILPGVEIGDDSVIAAGAVVTKNVPPQTLVAGVPAKFIRTLAKGETFDDAALARQPSKSRL